MMNLHTTFAAIGAVFLLAACGGSDSADSSNTAAGMSAADADGPKEIMAVYTDHIGRIADALEQVEDEESAADAAKVIRAATTEMEVLSQKVENMSQMERARLAMNFDEEFVQNQSRFAIAMAEIASRDEQHLQMVADALDDMPTLDN